MHRIAIILALLASTMATAKKAPEPKEFLDKSVITFPNSIGDYALAESRYDPEHWSHGVTSLWTINAAPDGVRLNVFVYPIGRADEKDVVAQQIAEVEDGMYRAVDQGIYADLVIDKHEAFAVVAAESFVVKSRQKNSSAAQEGSEDAKPDEPLALMPKPEFRLEAKDAADPLAATLAASMPAANNYGLRQSFRYTFNDVPVRSLGYVFYRHLFAFKVRITAPLDSMDDATFEALADTATRTLVPRIDVKNYGQCGNITVSESDPDADEETNSTAMAQQMLMGIARVRADNCASAEGKRSAASSRRSTRIEIAYPAGIWNSAD